MAEANTKPKTKKVVKYVGTADVREIDAASWKNVGAEDQKKVVWNKENRHQVDVSDLSAPALKYVENDDEGFVVEEVEI